MAVQNWGIDRTLVAGATLTSKQFYAVEMETDGKCDIVDAAGTTNAIVAGVLQDQSDSNNTIVDTDPIRVRVLGFTKAIAGAAVEEGVNVTVDNTGRFVTATGADSTNDYIYGRAFSAATAAGDIFEIFLYPAANLN